MQPSRPPHHHHHRPHHHANTQSHRHLQYPNISDPRVASNSRFTTFMATFKHRPFPLTRWQNNSGEVPLTLGSRPPIDITVRAQGGPIGPQHPHGYFFTVGVATGDVRRIDKRKLSSFLANYVAR